MTSHSTRTALTAAAALVAALFALAPAESRAQTTYASSVLNMNRGTWPGDFAPPQMYGGQLAGPYPVAMSNAQAEAAALGAPDDLFVSLPGGPQVPSTGFTGAFIELSFGADFSSDHLLTVRELGDNQESAQLFIWSNNGGNLQLTYTRGASDDHTVDLRPHAATLALMGATAWRSVTVGGLDENGSSKGFDLDAVWITAVPEPETYALMVGGLAMIGWMARRRGRRA